MRCQAGSASRAAQIYILQMLPQHSPERLSFGEHALPLAPVRTVWHNWLDHECLLLADCTRVVCATQTAPVMCSIPRPSAIKKALNLLMRYQGCA